MRVGGKEASGLTLFLDVSSGSTNLSGVYFPFLNMQLKMITRAWWHNPSLVSRPTHPFSKTVGQCMYLYSQSPFFLLQKESIPFTHSKSNYNTLSWVIKFPGQSKKLYKYWFGEKSF